MSRVQLSFFFFLGLIPVACCAVPSAAQKSDADTGMEVGQLQKAKVELNDIFKLRWKDDQLQIDEDHWIAAAGKSTTRDPYARIMERGNYPKSAKYISQLFCNVATKLGARNRGMSSSGTNQMTRTMASGELNATLTVGTERCSIEFTELNKPGRTLSLRSYKDGRMTIMILGGKEMLVIDQTADGAIRIMMDAGKGPRALFGKSFRELARSQGDLLSTELGQMMDHFGIAKPMLPYDEAVKRSVRARLELLHGMDAEKTFKELVDQFRSSEFSAREQASIKIDEKYDLYLSLISRELKRDDLQPEARLRLSRIVKQNSKANQISDVVRGFELLDSPEYLIAIGLDEKQADDKNLKTFVSARLKQITEQDFGQDLSAWKKWCDDREKASVKR